MTIMTHSGSVYLLGHFMSKNYDTFHRCSLVPKRFKIPTRKLILALKFMNIAEIWQVVTNEYMLNEVIMLVSKDGKPCFYII